MLGHSLLRVMLCLMLVLAGRVSLAGSPLESIERSIKKEPHYENAPQYLLLALGADQPALVWLVEDGRKLYIDRNTNGDLTDDGPPIVPSKERSFDQIVAGKTAKSWDYDYVLDRFAPVGRPEQTNFTMHRWNYGEAKEDSYGLELTLDGKVPMYAGWGPFWAKSPEKASIINFGGTLTPRTLRFKQFVIGDKMDRMSFAFMNRGFGKGADARLSIEAIAEDVLPEVTIKWPTKEGSPPLQTKHILDHRCCYWEYYLLDYDVPKDVIPGTAKATIKLPSDALALPLATDTIDIQVVAAKEKASAPK